MGLAERFMGQRDSESPSGALVANPAIERGPSFQLLVKGKLDLDEDAFSQAIRSFHPSLGTARAELLPVTLEEAPEAEAQSIIGLAGWGNHVVKLVGFNNPIPPKVFDMCVRPAHFSEELKSDAEPHQSHLLLYYAGHETDPLEQFVALSVVATALARFDGILLLNEAARSAFPAEQLLVNDPTHDSLDILRELPIPLLYGGFVKIEIEEDPGVWMRTFGNRVLKLPDLAFKAEGHHQGNDTFELFANMLAYLRESGSTFAAGHTMQIGDNTYMRLRAPTETEWYLDSDGVMLVVESISSAEVNRPA